MRLISPTLGRDEEATPQAIDEIVSALKERDDPFVILSQSDMTYVQALCTARGFIMEYQDDNVMNHYMSRVLLSRPKVIAALQSYLAGDPNWKPEAEFEKKKIADFWTRLGYSFGSFIGHFKRGFIEKQEKK